MRQCQQTLARLRCITAALHRSRVAARPVTPRACSTSNGADTTMPPQKFKLALCQLHVTPDKAANILTATAAIKEAVEGGAELVVLPEIWNSPYDNAAFPDYAEDVDGGMSESADALAEAARRHAITLVGGSIPERSEGKLYNTCLVYNRLGKLVAKHRKVHLFDIDIPGKITFRESDVLAAGDELTVVDTDVGRLGIGICYDLRFPELAMLYARQGVQLIVYPGAFNTTTGPLHWELLQRSRAVDNQLYVATCSPARNPDSSYQAWGHSTLVSPYGAVLATMEHESGILYATVDYAEIQERRQNMPLAKQRRSDLYDLKGREVLDLLKQLRGLTKDKDALEVLKSAKKA